MIESRSFAVRDDLALRVIDDDLIVYDPVSDTTRLLNRSAAAVVELCDGTRGLAAIVAGIAAAFSMPAAEVEQDVTAVVEQLCDQGILCCRDDPADGRRPTADD